MVVVELLPVERPLIRMIQVPRQRLEGEGHVLHQEIRLAPDRLEFVVVDYIDRIQVLVVTPQGRAIDIRILDHVHKELHVVRRDFLIFPFLSRNRVLEVMPQHPLA